MTAPLSPEAARRLQGRVEGLDDAIERLRPPPPAPLLERLAAIAARLPLILLGFVTTALPSGLAAGAAVIHLAMVPLHAGGSQLEAAAFVATAWLQAGLALRLARPDRPRWLLLATIAVNGVVMLAWLASRTVGLGAAGVHDVGAADGLATLFEGALVVTCVTLLRRPALMARAASPVGPVVPAVLLAAIASLALVQGGGHGLSEAGHHADETVLASDADQLQADGHVHGSAAVSSGGALDCASLRVELAHHWSADAADALTAAGCNVAATAAGGGGGDPALDGSPFADRRIADVAGAVSATGLAVCAVPNLPPGLLGSSEGVIFHLAPTWNDCAAPEGVVARLAVATQPSRPARDAIATSAGTDVARWAYGRFVIAALEGTSAELAGVLNGALTALDGAVAVPVPK